MMRARNLYVAMAATLIAAGAGTLAANGVSAPQEAPQIPLTEAYSAFATEQTSGDIMPEGSIDELEGPAARFGLDRSDTRYLGQLDGDRWYLASDGHSTCVIRAAANGLARGVGCGESSAMNRGPVLIASTADAGYALAGPAPDAVRTVEVSYSDGTQASVRVVDNLMSSTSTKRPTSVSWTDIDGARTTLPVTTLPQAG